MPVYITLLHYTQQGIENIKEGPARLERAREAISAAGGQLHAFYLTLGQYDAVSIGEVPSDEVYAATILALAAGGAVRTESLRAFTEDEYREIITSLP
jgi:uncharacterized protein with GYD domain